MKSLRKRSLKREQIPKFPFFFKVSRARREKAS